MPRRLDISGLRYGRLTALEPTTQRSGGKIVWRCKCDCGNECLAAVNQLQDGRRISCGCAKRGKQVNKTHGHYVGGKPTATYRSWSSMRSRCFNPNVREFPRYGGRGITICARWDSFENFLADMGPRPAGLTLDRWPDPDGNYEPENCRWATWSQQRTNQRLTDGRRRAEREKALKRKRSAKGSFLPLDIYEAQRAVADELDTIIGALSNQPRRKINTKLTVIIRRLNTIRGAVARMAHR
jgi:hypothetical protein